jgi:hypothetical protein
MQIDRDAADLTEGAIAPSDFAPAQASISIDIVSSLPGEEVDKPLFFHDSPNRGEQLSGDDLPQEGLGLRLKGENGPPATVRIGVRA